MNAARRSSRRKSWPRGLYESRPGYFIWRKPGGGALSIGRVPVAVAINEAIAANRHVEALRPSLVDRLTGAANTVQQLLGKMPAADNRNTAKSWRSLDKKIGARLGRIVCQDLTVADCAEAFDAELAEVGARSAQALRSRMVAVCQRGQELGWMDGNPARVTKPPRVDVQRQRLTLETFRAIYEVAEQVAEWLPLAMRIALVTGMDRSTLAGLERSARKADDLEFTRGKVNARIAIPLRLRLNVQGWELKDVLDHKTGVVSRYFLHHVNPWGNAPAGSKVHPDRISHAFTEARKLAGVPDERAPTFHEIRSLAKRLYDEQGNVDTKVLLGHSTEKMSNLYGDSRGAEVKRVRVA